MNIDKILDEAYSLYMPQDRNEINLLSKYVDVYHINKLRSLEYGMTTVEIGTKFGGTFYIWCNLFNSEDDKNISIDMSDGGIHGGISELEMDNRDLWFYERFINCEFIRGDSHSINTKQKLQSLLEPNGYIFDMPKKTVDFLFIDGDHSYEGVKQDFEMYSPFVKHGGIIAFHDINDSQKHRDRNVYVSRFWNEIKKDPRFDAIEFNSNLDWAGIGVLVLK